MSWIQSRIKAAEGLLEAVDEGVTQFIARKKEENTSDTTSTTDLKEDRQEPADPRGSNTLAATELLLEKSKQSRKEEPSRESRLLKVCEDLRSQLHDVQKQAEQTRSQLRASEQQREEQVGELEKLMDELHKGDNERHRLEATLQAQALAQEMELTKAQTDGRIWKEKMEVLESQWASLHETRQQEDLKRTSQLARVTEDLRSEMGQIEEALQREQEAHAQSVAGAEEREEQLQQELSASAELLATLQHQTGHKTEALSQLEEEVLSLRRAQRSEEDRSTSVEGLLQQRAAQIEAMREELRAERRQRDEAERRLKKTLEELDAARRADVFSSNESLDRGFLKAQLEEVRELLCQKQAELERATSYAASIDIFHERNARQLKDQIDRLTAQLHHADAVVPVRQTQRPTATHVGQSLKHAVLFLDRTASRAASLIKHYPIGRVVVLLYVVLLHVYLYVLSSRMEAVAVAQNNKPNDRSS